MVFTATKPTSAGRPKGSIKPAESLLVPTYSPRKNELVKDDETKGKYKCCACGDRYKNLEANFPYSQSVFFKGNGNRLPICNNCIDNFTNQYQELFNSQDEAIGRMALHWDIYLTDSLLESSKKIDASRSRIKGYIKNCNLSQNAGRTYDTYLSEIEVKEVYDEETLAQLKSEGKFTPTVVSMERWGAGLPPANYKILDEHYRYLKKTNPDCDDNQEIFIKDLCYTKLQQLKAMKDENSDDFKTFTALYRDTFKAAGLTTKQETAITNNPDDCWGVFQKIIETTTPAEYFKDKKIFKDYDEMDKYYKRFIERPTNNLINGTTNMDEEFSIKVTDDD